MPLQVSQATRFQTGGAGAVYGHRFWVPSKSQWWLYGGGSGQFRSVRGVVGRLWRLELICFTWLLLFVRAVRVALVVAGFG